MAKRVKQIRYVPGAIDAKQNRINAPYFLHLALIFFSTISTSALRKVNDESWKLDENLRTNDQGANESRSIRRQVYPEFHAASSFISAFALGQPDRPI